MIYSPGEINKKAKSFFFLYHLVLIHHVWFYPHCYIADRMTDPHSSLAIHVVDSLSATEGKRKIDQSHGEDSHKKQKLSTEPSQTNPSNQNTQSFRHLFSFGDKGNVTNQAAVKVPESKKPAPKLFTLLNNIHSDDSGKNEEDEPTLDGPEPTTVNVEDERSHPAHDEDIDMKDIAEEPTHEDYPSIDPFDTVAVAEIAKMFCRQKTVEELEVEWEGGLREQMKRDFKVKRQMALRVRKLGGSRV